MTEYDVIANRMLQLISSPNRVVCEDDTWRTPHWGDMAVLLQARTPLPKLEKALSDRNIPYVVYGGVGFYSKQEVIDVLSLLKWIHQPWESSYILAILRSPAFGVDMNGFLELKQAIGDMHQLSSYLYERRFSEEGALSDGLKSVLRRFCSLFERWIPFPAYRPMRDRLRALCEESGLYTSLLLQPNSLQKIQNVEKLIDVIEGLGVESLDEVLTTLERIASLSEKEGEAEYELVGGNSVHIMTVHASKGLEFPIVFAPGIDRAPMNDKGHIRFSKDDWFVLKFEPQSDVGDAKEIKAKRFLACDEQSKHEAFEEYKRLFYVAATRARDYLILSGSIEPGKAPPSQPKNALDFVRLALGRDARLYDFITIQEDIAAEGEAWNEASKQHYSGPSKDVSLVAPVTFSVSEVMAFLNRPVEYYEKHVLKVNPDWFEVYDEVETSVDVDLQIRSRLDPGTLGTRVHAACELMDSGFVKDEAIEESLFMLEDEGERDLYREEVTALVDTYPMLARSIGGETVATEWPFELRIGSVNVIGKIDKVVRDGDTYHVIDLKTNRLRDVQGLVAYYKPQLHLYKMAYEAVNGVSVGRMSLVFLRDSEYGLQPVEFDSEYETVLKGTIQKMAQMKRNCASRVEYERLEGHQKTGTSYI